MLLKLSIKNVALIDKLECNFFEGLNILTGETGAGKSIIIDSLNLVLGGRTSKELIRTSQDTAIVEAFFDTSNSKVHEYLHTNELYGDDDTVVLCRELNINGKSICRINGRVVTVSMLKKLGQMLVDIHGQHDNQSLLNTDIHIDLLDNFGEQITSIKEEYYKRYQGVKELEQKVEQLGGNRLERERKLDLLKFQLNEIQTANLKEDEDEELEKQRNIMINSNKIVTSVQQCYDILYAGEKHQSIIDSINIVIKELSGISEYDKKIDEFLNKAEDIFYSLEDIIQEIRSYKEGLEFDPNQLNFIEERLDYIYKLKRKYGQTIKEVLEFKDGLEREISELLNSEELITKYNSQLETLKSQMESKAKELSDMRKQIAKELKKRIIKELEDLNMKRTQFEVDFREVEFGPKGKDKIEFLISPNQGENLKPLSKIVSGGEMSRVLLAIKTILAKVDKVPVLIFDEIDMGISGKVAQMVGQKLSHISKNHQVLCVTHQPQIASMADNHYSIQKQTINGQTLTTIKKLNQEERKHEIAKILGGINITETTIKHAEEMIQLASDKTNT